VVHPGLERFASIFLLLSLAGCSSNVPLGGSCEPPPGLQTVSAQNATGVAIDGTSVYWTSLPAHLPDPGGLNAIVKAPIGGGAVTTLESVTTPALGPVLVDATSIYWFDEGAVRKADKTDGHNAIVLANPFGGSFYGMAIDATSLYWCGASSDMAVGGAVVMKVDKMGGSPITLAAEPQFWNASPAVDATNVYYATGRPPTMNGVSGAVVSVPVAGGTPRTLVSGPDVYVGSVAVEGSYVYYVTEPYLQGPDTLMRVPVGGGAATTLASESAPIVALAVDSTNVYWGGSGIGLKSMPLAGGATTEPAPCQFPTGIAVNNTSLYWVNDYDAHGSNGSLMRLTPK
jgi:hypothetical protein